MATITLQSFNRSMLLTKSDTVSSPLVGGRGPQAIWVGGAGVVRVIYDDDSTDDFTCVAGTILPIACKRINSTGTTATLTIGLYQL